MKNLLIILLFAAAMGCKEEDTVQMGCQTGIYKGATVRVFIRCCTQEEHLAGNNPAAGGSTLLTYFTSVKWAPIDDCNNCK
jgi:hypothetical protein